MTNEMSTTVGGQELVVGDEIEALGAAPGGDGRVWFWAKVVALRSRYPPLHVKFKAVGRIDTPLHEALLTAHKLLTPFGPYLTKPAACLV